MLFASLGIVACAHATTREEPAFPALASAPVVLPTLHHAGPPKRLIACEGNEEKLHVLVEGELAMSCWPEVRCKRALRFLVTNCTDEDAELTELLIDRKAVGSRFEFESGTFPLPRRSERWIDYGWPDAGTIWTLGPHTMRARAGTLEADTEFSIADPAKLAAQEECRRNGDDWGMHGGMLKHEGCEHVMRDAGQRCVDGRECEGDCVLEKQWSVSKTMQRVQGRCSSPRFGCHVMIGDTDHGLMPANAQVVRTCAD